jgi:hypothetical protein
MDDGGLRLSRDKPTRDGGWYLLGAVAGIATGCADVAIRDPLLTALLVVFSCLLLGIARPRRPWRWVLTVGVFIPLTGLAARAVLTANPTRAQSYGAFLGFLPGIAGAYGGSFLRSVVDNLRQGK